MPINEGRIGEIVADRFQAIEPRLLTYLAEKEPKDPANLALSRYFGKHISEPASLWKGVSSILGKAFYQPVIERIAGDVHGQEVSTGRDKIDMELKRHYYAEWFERVCSDHDHLGTAPTHSNESQHRIYVVQLKTDVGSASGGTKGDAVDSLLTKVTDVRREGQQDVVAVFYNVFGTTAESRHSSRPALKNLYCYEISGKIGFDWLVGDPNGRLFDVFCAALRETPISTKLAELLTERGYL